MAETIRISISNWDKHQADHGRNTYLWFKFHNAFFRRGHAKRLGPIGVVVWLYCICECADRRSETIEIDLEMASAATGLKTHVFEQQILQLIQGGYASFSPDQNKAVPISHMKLPTKLVEASSNRIDKNRIERNSGSGPNESIIAEANQSDIRETPPLEATPLVQVWNQNCGTLPPVRAVNKSRIAKATSRWSERPEADYWIEVIRRLAASPFCRGENDRGWKASFDFLLKPDTHLKVTEGFYDSRKPGNTLVKSAEEILNNG